jgi:hypothetical protein
MNINDLMRQLTDTIYMELFGKTTNELYQFFGLPLPAEDDWMDDAIRNRMSELALDTLMSIETKAAYLFHTTTFATYQEGVKQLAAEYAKKASTAAQEKGIDLLTGV